MKMKDFEDKLFEKFSITKMNAEYKFPWDRFFEVEVNLKNVYTPLPFVDILFCE